MTVNKTVLNTDSSFDFGFSFADEKEVSAPHVQITLNTEAKYKAKLLEVENMIIPLLRNLMKNPEKSYIKWENRVPVIEKQIEKILAVTRS